MSVMSCREPGEADSQSAYRETKNGFKRSKAKNLRMSIRGLSHKRGNFSLRVMHRSRSSSRLTVPSARSAVTTPGYGLSVALNHHHRAFAPTAVGFESRAHDRPSSLGILPVRGPCMISRSFTWIECARSDSGLPHSRSHATRSRHAPPHARNCGAYRPFGSKPLNVGSA